MEQEAQEQRDPIGFGERLKDAREAKNISGVKLGNGLQKLGAKNASRQTISDWEAERHYPTVWQLKHLCERLDQSADFLVLGRQVAAGLTAEASAIAAAIDGFKGEDRARVLQMCWQAIEFARNVGRPKLPPDPEQAANS